jgi:hypothetical protein
MSDEIPYQTREQSKIEDSALYLDNPGSNMLIIVVHLRQPKHVGSKLNKKQ